MKITLDIPAPTKLLETLSRLKQKNRNYKTQLKQLSRAHFITKTLLKDAQTRNLVLVERIGALQRELAEAKRVEFDPNFYTKYVSKVDAEVSFDHPI